MSSIEAESSTSSVTDGKVDDGTPTLGGVWLHRQVEDEMEESPEEEGGEGYVYDGSDDDRTTFSEDSLPTTPLSQLEDLSVFDPLAGDTEIGGGNHPTLHTSNSWLFQAMDLCADLKGDSPDTSHQSSLANSSTDLSSDSGITLQLPQVPDSSPLGDPFSAPPGEPAVLPVSQDLGFFKSSNQDVSRDKRSSMAHAYLRCIRAQEAAERDAQMGGNAGIIDSREESPNPSPQHTENRSRTISGDSISKLVVNGEDDYLFKAARAIGLALQNEASGYYQAAFDSYKAGVSILLNGVTGETNKMRREAVRKKTAQYLMRAEDVYNNYLSDMDNSKRWESETLEVENDPSSEHLRGSVEELKNFKVLGVVDKVMLVLDMTNYQTYVVKVLNKCAVLDEKVRTCVPSYCPHMVRLCRFIESNSSIFLVLEYASGGKLWEYVSCYLNQEEVDARKASPTGVKVVGTRSQSPPHSPRTKSILSSGDDAIDNRTVGENGKHYGPSSGEVDDKHVSHPDQLEKEKLNVDGHLPTELDGTLTISSDTAQDAGLPINVKPREGNDINWISSSPASSGKPSDGGSTPVRMTLEDLDKLGVLGVGDVGGNSGDFDIVDEGVSLNDLVEQSSGYFNSENPGNKAVESTAESKVPPPISLFSIDSVESPPETGSAGIDDRPVFGYPVSNNGEMEIVNEDVLTSPQEAKRIISDALEVIDMVNEISQEDSVPSYEPHGEEKGQTDIVDTSGFSEEVFEGYCEIPKPGDAGVESFKQTDAMFLGDTLYDNRSVAESGKQQVIGEIGLTDQSIETKQSSESKKRSSTWDEFFKLNEYEDSDGVGPNLMHVKEDGSISKESNSSVNKVVDINQDGFNVCVNPFEYNSNRVSGGSEVINTLVTVDDPTKPRRTSVEVMKEWPSSGTNSSHSTPQHQNGKGKEGDRTRVHNQKDSVKIVNPEETGNNDKVSSDQTEVVNESEIPSVLKTANEQNSTGTLTNRSTRLPSLSKLFSQLDDIRKGQGKVFLPESCVCIWAAEIVVAVSSLHAYGIICRDLNPANILLAQGGHIRLTYFSHWKCIKPVLSSFAVEHFYVAPEVLGLQPLTPACDWWSCGVLLFELLTGQALYTCHPCGISTHTELSIPDHVSSEGRSLLKQLIQPVPHERLGAGRTGVDEIKSHPFFANVDWKTVRG
ncbi:Ribosomal protein S6 kinase delta-1 [Holothuria leucospilota]|uniref:Ribosomal protein S6 kinase delta-1 n=1 Tax=Holothuria leucospilota TaxID=206669 RepID=A0A9Q1CHA3_HOLLE|nr:Ribosomal protein S6 kinase delta-1 [Holothuria leucospilota]